MKHRFPKKTTIGGSIFTREQYNDMFVAQAGCCAICGRHQTELNQRLGVDHCHQTQEQAEQRLELNCLEIAQELGGTVEIKDCIVFNFSHANF